MAIVVLTMSIVDRAIGSGGKNRINNNCSGRSGASKVMKK
jgi:hypothetical protein